MKAAMPLAKKCISTIRFNSCYIRDCPRSIQKKIHGSGVKLIIEQEDMKDIIKIIESLENSGILLKRVSKTIENETKEQRGEFKYVTWYFRS